MQVIAAARLAKAKGVLAALLISCGLLAHAQTSASAPNSDPTYQALRNVGLGGEAFTVSKLDVKRDAGHFHLHSGTVCFLAPVNGKVTGAVFQGDGTLILDPPIDVERKNLKMLTGENEFSENFDHAVFRFTDSTYDEIKKGSTPSTGTCDAGPLKESQHATRHRLHFNLDARILADVFKSSPGGLFVAFIHGSRYSDKMLFAVDPQGVPEFAESVVGFDPIAINLSPEEVCLMTYGENKHGYWSAFHFSNEYNNGVPPAGEQKGVIHIASQKLDTTIEKNGFLSGKATTTLVARENEIRVLPFRLYRTLRVQSVTGGNGKPLSFIQEDKNDDFQFSVILPAPLAAGEKTSITTTYSGKEAVIDEGGGNYYPASREDWYPATGGPAPSDFSDYDMTFRIPKNLQITATGAMLSQTIEGGQSVSIWKSEVPQQVAGFQLGDLKEEDVKASSTDVTVAAYANREPPDFIRPLMGHALGNFSTVSIMKGPLSEAQYAVTLYSGYFGPLPVKRLSISQQTACTYGQSWPQLVWLPICSFFDSTQRHAFGLDFRDRGYWDAVTPHEVAHQWWGHLVGFGSYRDQWISEGFSDFSASLFLQNAYGEKGEKMFLKFWSDERLSITEKSKMGFRPIDVGPLTLGYRLNNGRSGDWVARGIIYPKGAFVLHMIRMMMWDRQYHDQLFKETMQDFVKTYTGRSATTEDFKAIVEKHMTDQMKTFGNGSMDWFFNEYVYGTELPTYNLETADFTPDASGSVILNLKLKQSGVSDNFRMLVPIYLELSNGSMFFLGRARLVGNTTYEQKIPLKGLQGAPRRALINYYYDVLAN